MQPIYFNQGMSHKVTSKYVLVDQLNVNGYSNIEITLSDLDIVNGTRIPNSQCRYTISTREYQSGTNYSLGNAFGAILGTQPSFDLTQLISLPCLAFIHKKNSQGQPYSQLFDLMPLEWMGWRFEVEPPIEEMEGADESV